MICQQVACSEVKIGEGLKYLGAGRNVDCACLRQGILSRQHIQKVANAVFVRLQRR
jgi:hypothetical protein